MSATGLCVLASVVFSSRIAALTNAYGITLDRAWTEWASKPKLVPVLALGQATSAPRPA